MPFISEAASAIKSRLGFEDQSSMPLVRSSPDLFKSESKENLLQFSAIRDDHSGRASKQSFELIEDPSFWKDHNVQVIIRVRPLSSSEISLQGYSRCVKQDSCQTITWTGHPESRFTFDLVADENVNQEELFKVAGVPMVDNCMGGYNSCMFAYGQTGSGKTHTMLGDIEGGARRHSVNCGMTPRVFEYLFSRIQKEKDARREEKLKFTCKCSFLEIYNEQILDLLDPTSTNLQLREDTKKGVYVDNLTEVEVTCARDVIQQLVQWESQGVTHHLFARLNLVDLAGSERQKSSGAEGERLKEATNINKSLSTLGLVIMNLVNISTGKSLHVPYRDSKLTFLLQDSLGGNAKTIIIANISPCSLETLSTLKFAQRAKFIKNHAIVNEDASGDVLAMRVQIQQLKKEVSRLKGLVNGGAGNHESDAWTVSFPGSPGSFKWEGLHGSLISPLTSDKRISQKKEYEVALVGAFRREKDKDIALQALAAENQAAMQLKLELRGWRQLLLERYQLRHILLQEREEYLKEIEVIRTQVDRNQEIEVFFEEGERERMNEQITILQNKLLEALDWKLMHDSDASIVQKGNSDSAIDIQSDGDLLVSTKEPGSPWHTSINEENEFLRMQAIQNQSEMDTLRKKLNFCLEEKDKFERHVTDFVTELEAERSSKVQKEEAQKLQIPNIALNDQMELKAMVDAIAAANQREAEAHETAIILSKENDELQKKLKVLIEDNNKLIELYDRANSENADKSMVKVHDPQEYKTEDHSNHFGEFGEEKELEVKREVENLEHQLAEMHEENEKLMALYEKAMQERDEFKRMLSFGGQNIVEIRKINYPEKLVEVDGGKCHNPDEHHVSGEELMREETNCFGSYMHDGGESLQCSGNSQENDSLEVDEPPTCAGANSGQHEQIGMEIPELEKPTSSDESKVLVEETHFPSFDMQDGSNLCHEDPQVVAENQTDFENDSDLETKSLNLTMVKVSEDLDLVRTKLDRAQEKLLNSAQTVSVFWSLEKAITEVDKLSKEIEAMEEAIQMKKQEYASLESLSCEMHERRGLIDRKLTALKYSISSFSSSVGYFEQREVQARARVNASLSYLDRKKEELACLQVRKNEIEDALRKFQQLEVELTSDLALLKSKIEEENQRLESEKVLFAIENIERTDVPHSQRNWHLSGKATELLKSEEEKTKIQTEMKQAQEKIGIMRKEVEDLNRKLREVESEVQVVQTDVQKGSTSAEEMEHKLQAIIKEKEMLLEMKENGSTEVENMILEYPPTCV
ncbi:hypothetical protein HYC85_031072 [Camellia sinensis]|uniref:Kinesin motor domain-containing protein n=1 Tax=Camellia sinensis TaxID=4442 RepID=A0A7J7FQ04_CAMSI|nr:hypothetical protein HYC85_031072 [Camellia sinensis]